MKKTSVLVFVLFLGISLNGFSQTGKPQTAKPVTTTPAQEITKDFFAGKWEVSIVGTPNGDAKFVTELTRKEGKLTGELKDSSGKIEKAIPLTKVEEENAKITFYFTTADGYDVSIVLAKVDESNLKGSTLDQFATTAVRVKN